MTNASNDNFSGGKLKVQGMKFLVKVCNADDDQNHWFEQISSSHSNIYSVLVSAQRIIKERNARKKWNHVVLSVQPINFNYYEKYWEKFFSKIESIERYDWLEELTPDQS